MWNIFEKMMKQNGYKIADVARATGIPYSTFTDWKAGRYTPKIDKMQKIADFFSVSLDYLMTGNAEARNGYYINDDTAKMAQQIFEDRNLRTLFDAAKDSTPEDLQMAASLLKRLKGTNPDA